MAWSDAQRVSRTIVGDWTYSGDPSTSDRDAVRFALGDIDKEDGLLGDKEIDYAVAQENSIQAAAARCAQTLALYFAREADKSIGDVRTSLSQRSSAYSKLAKELKARAASLASPYVGGISIDDKDAREDETDRVVPSFTRGQFDYT